MFIRANVERLTVWCKNKMTCRSLFIRYLVILIYPRIILFQKASLLWYTAYTYKRLTKVAQIVSTLKKPNSNKKKSLSVALLFRLFHKGYVEEKCMVWIGPQVSNSFWMSSMFLSKSISSVCIRIKKTWIFNVQNRADSHEYKIPIVRVSSPECSKEHFILQ